MKLIKKLQIKFLKNIKIIIIILISLSLNSIIFYLDIFNLFNNNYVDLEPALLELSEELKDLNPEEKEEDLNLEKTLNKTDNNKIYYVIGGIILIVGGLFLLYYLNDIPPPEDNIREILSNLYESEKKSYYDKDTGRLVEIIFPHHPEPDPNDTSFY